MRRRHLLRALPALPALAALLVAGCASSDDAAGDATGVTRATVPVVDTAADPIVSTAGTMGDTMGGAAADGFCGLVTTDDLAELFPDAVPGELTSDEGPVCTWPVGDGLVEWRVESASYASLESAAGGAAEAIDGVGDRAFFEGASAGGSSVVTEAGDVVYAVRFTAGRDGTTDATVERDVLARVAARLTAATFG